MTAGAPGEVRLLGGLAARKDNEAGRDEERFFYARAAIRSLSRVVCVAPCGECVPGRGASARGGASFRCSACVVSRVGEEDKKSQVT